MLYELCAVTFILFALKRSCIVSRVYSHVLSLEVMSLSTSSSANTCKPASKQTTIISYFALPSNGLKRKRKNLEVLGTDAGNTEATAAFDERGEKVTDPRQFGRANDDRDDCLAVSGRLEVDSTPITSQSSQQSESDSSDIIPPSPVAASKISLIAACTGSIKKASDQRITRRDGTGPSATDWSTAAVLDDSKILSSIKDSAEERLNCEQTSENEQEMREVDTSKTTCHVIEREEDEHSVVSKLLSAHMPHPLPAEIDSEFRSKLPAAEASIDNSSEALQLDLPSARRHFVEKSNKWKNVEFYMNKIESVPRGAKIEEMLLHWKGDYDKLETHHGYIQWLFPIAERGMNSHAQPLTDKEAEFMRSSHVARGRMLRAYCMMLDFFGIELKDKHTGKLQRGKNWRERLSHLNRSCHNYLRVTRMLKCFEVVDLAWLQAPLVHFLMYETFAAKTLSNCQRSCVTYWLPAVTSDEERLRLECFLRRIRQHS